MSEDTHYHVSGLIFVALMFIGAGIGLLFGRPDVGGAIGMGIGFLAMALMRVYRIRIESEKSISLKSIWGSIILSLIGILFIVSGVVMLMGYRFEIVMKYVGGFVAIAIGLVFVALALNIISHR